MIGKPTPVKRRHNIRETVLALLRMPFTLLLGLLLGVLATLVMPEAVRLVSNAHDSAFPVVQMSGVRTARDRDSVIIHVYGRKLRGEECRLLRMYAYTLDEQGRRSDAYAQRLDRPQSGQLRGEGDYDLGLWKVFPVDAYALRAQLLTHHICVGRDVLSKIADVDVR